jgi:PAS domain S-box-containing protein
MGQVVGIGLFIAVNIGICILAGRFRTKSEAVRESEARLQMAHQVAHIGAFEWNVQTGVNNWTPELEAMYGLKAGEFGRTEQAWEELVHPEDRAKAVATVERALASFQPEEGEWRVVWPDGTVHWLQGRFQTFKDHAGKPLRLSGVNIDITNQKRAQAEILALRDRLAEDLAGMNRLHALSTRFVRQGGMKTLLDAILEAAIVLTRADKGHIQVFDPDSGSLSLIDQRGLGPAFSKYIRPGVLACGAVMQTQKRVVVKDVTLSPLYLADPPAMEFVLELGMRAVVCVPLLTRSGQFVGTLSTLFAVPHQPNERELRLLDLLARQVADFIERTKAEESLRAAREELANANADLERKVEERTAKLREAMDELEHMSYSMVHDMRAPLRAMQGFAEMIQQECADDLHSSCLDYLGRIRESSGRLDRLITDALNYNQVVRQNLPLKPVDLGKLLRGMVQTYPNLQPPSAPTLPLTSVTWRCWVTNLSSPNASGTC